MPEASFFELSYLQMDRTLYPWTDFKFTEMWDLLFRLLVVNQPGDPVIPFLSLNYEALHGI